MITRSCLWEDVDAAPDSCQNLGQQLPSYVRIVSCRTCATDGCNGAPNFGMPDDPEDTAEVKSTDLANNEMPPAAPGAAPSAATTLLAMQLGSMVSMLVLALGFVHMWTQLLH